MDVAMPGPQTVYGEPPAPAVREDRVEAARPVAAPDRRTDRADVLLGAGGPGGRLSASRGIATPRISTTLTSPST
jgi:hypothetical protein